MEKNKTKRCSCTIKTHSGRNSRAEGRWGGSKGSERPCLGHNWSGLRQGRFGLSVQARMRLWLHVSSPRLGLWKSGPWGASYSSAGDVWAICSPGIKFTIDNRDDGARTSCWPSGASVQRSLNVESTVLFSSGRACEPLRTREPQGGAGVLSAAGRGSWGPAKLCGAGWGQWLL